MLQAMLGGKLSSRQENMEDVLTSCVFGCFRYMDPNDGLVPLLRQARGHDPNERPFAGLTISKQPGYEFWPFWGADGYRNCEPDVVVTCDDESGNQWLVLIEVKYRSGKSAYADEESEVPTDQLAKEWDQLVAVAKESGRKPILVYITSDVTYPSDDIAGAASEYQHKRRQAANYEPMQCYWLSWRSLYRLFQDSSDVIGQDLAALASRLGLREFDGFSPIQSGIGIEWRYSVSFSWAFQVEQAEWRYQA